MLILSAVAMLLVASPAAPSAKAGLHVIKSIPLGGEGGWDYLTLDSDTRRLYITRGDHVTVLDIDTEKVVGEVKDTQGVHGVAIAPDLKRGFTSNGRANTATIFDLGTLAKMGEVKTGSKPDAIIYDAGTHRVFAFNGDSHDVTAIDAAAGTVAGTIALGGVPEFAVIDGKGTVFVNIEDKAEIVAIDARELKVKSRWSLAPGTEPTGLAVDKEKGRLFAGCHNELMVVVAADSGKLLATLPIGRGVDATAFDATRRLAFSSNGDGTLTVAKEDAPGHFIVVENAKTQMGARTMALDPRTHRIFLATAQFGPPPAPTAERPHPRSPALPNTFVILVVGE
jgi:DNA-binding beta-propeller fold protein YncE